MAKHHKEGQPPQGSNANEACADCVEEPLEEMRDAAETQAQILRLVANASAEQLRKQSESILPADRASPER